MGKSNRGRIIGQDKDVEKITKRHAEDVIGKFKEQYADRHENPNKPILGFELNGGKYMTEKADKEWKEFEEWCAERELIAIYNNNEDLENM